MVIRSVEYAGTCSISKCYGAYKGFYSLDRLIAVLWTPSPSHKPVPSASPVLPGGQWRRASEMKSKLMWKLLLGIVTENKLLSKHEPLNY